MNLKDLDIETMSFKSLGNLLNDLPNTLLSSLPKEDVKKAQDIFDNLDTNNTDSIKKQISEFKQKLDANRG